MSCDTMNSIQRSDSGMPTIPSASYNDICVEHVFVCECGGECVRLYVGACV